MRSKLQRSATQTPCPPMSLESAVIEQTVADLLHSLQAVYTNQAGYEREALELLKLGNYNAATTLCRTAEKAARTNSSSQTPLTRLQDSVALLASLKGSVDGFDGRTLEVRNAGEDAWLGGPAAKNPALDAPADMQSDRFLLDSSAADPLDSARSSGKALTRRPRVSFRSIKDALDAAQDGDRIVLLKGVHNGMGEAVNVSKRVLIMGEGVLGEVTVDQRANSPAFRISRSCVIQNLSLDMTGFRECISVTGSKSVLALLRDCNIWCSGSDAVNLSGKTTAILQRCSIRAKKAGIQAFETVYGVFTDCTISECGEAGLQAQDRARLHVERSAVSLCKQEGCVAMQSAFVSMQDCQISDCDGPALDVSDEARAELRGCVIGGNTGGIWMWDGSSAFLEGSTCNGGSSFPLLVEGCKKPIIQGSTFCGQLDRDNILWSQVLKEGVNNAVIAS